MCRIELKECRLANVNASELVLSQRKRDSYTEI